MKVNIYFIFFFVLLFLFLSYFICFYLFLLIPFYSSKIDEDGDGNGNFTMRFRVNGANLFARGANMIPMEEYEGWANADAFRFLVHSAKDANMNILRIWYVHIYSSSFPPPPKILPRIV